MSLSNTCRLIPATPTQLQCDCTFRLTRGTWACTCCCVHGLVHVRRALAHISGACGGHSCLPTHTLWLACAFSVLFGYSCAYPRICTIGAALLRCGCMHGDMLLHAVPHGIGHLNMHGVSLWWVDLLGLFPCACIVSGGIDCSFCMVHASCPVGSFLGACIVCPWDWCMVLWHVACAGDVLVTWSYGDVLVT